MAENFIRQGALAPLGLAARAGGAADAGVRLEELAPRGQILLRGDGSKKAFRDAVGRAIGIAPPVQPNTAAGPVDMALGPRALWLGPDEWLIVAPAASAATIGAALRSALAEHHALVLDVADARAAIGVAGPRARAVLSKGCPLDLHPRVFGPGQCAQSLLARATVLIHQASPEPAYEIYVARSYALYMWRWLEDAAAEYGYAIRA